MEVFIHLSVLMIMRNVLLHSEESQWKYKDKDSFDVTNANGLKE